MTMAALSWIPLLCQVLEKGLDIRYLSHFSHMFSEIVNDYHPRRTEEETGSGRLSTCQKPHSQEGAELRCKSQSDSREHALFQTIACFSNGRIGY